MMTVEATVFLKRDERVHLAATLVFALLVAAEVSLPISSPVRQALKSNFSDIAFFTGIVMFEALHVIITYLGLALLPELGEWAKKSARAERFG